MAAISITIPFLVVSILADLVQCLGEDYLGVPRKIEMREPDGQPPRAMRARWRQQFDFWRPGLYVRVYATGTVHPYGIGTHFIGARLRFLEKGEAVNLLGREGVFSRPWGEVRPWGQEGLEVFILDSKFRLRQWSLGEYWEGIPPELSGLVG